MFDVKKLLEIENELILNVFPREMNDEKMLSYIAGVADTVNVIMLKLEAEEK